jgi:hypothetical protein
LTTSLTIWNSIYYLLENETLPIEPKSTKLRTSIKLSKMCVAIQILFSLLVTIYKSCHKVPIAPKCLTSLFFRFDSGYKLLDKWWDRVWYRYPLSLSTSQSPDVCPQFSVDSLRLNSRVYVGTSHVSRPFNLICAIKFTSPVLILTSMCNVLAIFSDILVLYIAL